LISAREWFIELYPGEQFRRRLYDWQTTQISVTMQPVGIRSGEPPTTMADEASQSSATGKIGWLIVSTVVTALIGIPLGYYLVGPLTPKATLTARMSGKAGAFFLFSISNESSDLFARNAAITFLYTRDDRLVATPDIVSDPTCVKHDPMLSISSHSFICDNVIPKSTLTFTSITWLSPSKPSPDHIRITIVYDGYDYTKTYTRCHKPEDQRGGYYVVGNTCSRGALRATDATD
jgi:hypothetical protein